MHPGLGLLFSSPRVGPTPSPVNHSLGCCLGKVGALRGQRRCRGSAGVTGRLLLLLFRSLVAVTAHCSARRKSYSPQGMTYTSQQLGCGAHPNHEAQGASSQLANAGGSLRCWRADSPTPLPTSRKATRVVFTRSPLVHDMLPLRKKKIKKEIKG